MPDKYISIRKPKPTATIRYELGTNVDGAGGNATDPTSTSAVLSEPILIEEPMQIKAIATYPTGKSSKVVTMSRNQVFNKLYQVQPDIVNDLSAANEYMYDPATVAYMNAMNANSKSENMSIAMHIDSYVIALKAAGLWDMFDAMWLMATNDESGTIQANDMCLINIIDPSIIGTPVSSPYLKNKSGIQGSANDNTAGGYIKSACAPNGNTSKFKGLDQSLGVYYHSGNSADLSEIGRMDSGTTGSYVGSLFGANMFVRTGSATQSYVNTDIKQIKIGRRGGTNASTHQYASSGKTFSAALAAGYASFSARQFYLLARNNFGTGGAESPALFSNKRISMAFIGKYLTDNNIEALVDIFDSYLAAIGAV